jgi:hypothetical protein
MSSCGKSSSRCQPMSSPGGSGSPVLLATAPAVAAGSFRWWPCHSVALLPRHPKRLSLGDIFFGSTRDWPLGTSQAVCPGGSQSISIAIVGRNDRGQ